MIGEAVRLTPAQWARASDLLEPGHPQTGGRIMSPEKVRLTREQRARAADLLERVVGDDDALEELVYRHIALLDRGDTEGTDAAQRCADATGHAIVAWRAPRFVVASVHPSQIIG